MTDVDIVIHWISLREGRGGGGRERERERVWVMIVIAEDGRAEGEHPQGRAGFLA